MSATETFTVDRQPPKRLSMSFIRAAEGCLRRADLERDVYLSGPLAVVGSVFHDVAAAVGFACSMKGETSPDPDEAERIARRVLDTLDGPVPKEAFDTVLGWVQWWAGRTTFRPGEQFEIDSRVELDGRVFSARLDRVAVDGDAVFVTDYKTGWAEPPTKLPLQGEVYAWHAWRRHPDVEVVVYEEEYLRHRDNGGPWQLTRSEHMAGIEAFLVSARRRIDRAYAKQRLDPTPGSACSSPSRCPVAASCPIPEWARPETVIDDDDQAVAELGRLLVLEAQAGDVRDRLKGWLAHSGERAVQVGGEEYGYSLTPGSRFDKKQLAADLAGRGVDLDLDAYAKPTKPSLGRRKAVGE